MFRKLVSIHAITILYLLSGDVGICSIGNMAIEQTAEASLSLPFKSLTTCRCSALCLRKYDGGPSTILGFGELIASVPS